MAAVLVYWNSLGGGFVWDDRFLIVDNPRIQSFSRLSELLTHDYVFIAETDLAYGYFRPVSSLSVALDYRIWGADPFGFHFTNLLLHAASSLLVCLLALGLGARRAVAWATGWLFAIHPIHTESVAWIAGRTDLLAFLLAGASFGLFLLVERPGGTLARRLAQGGSLALLALALLAKEMAAVVPLWIACVVFWRSPPAGFGARLERALRVAAPWLVIVVLYAIVRFFVLVVPPPDVPAEHTLARAMLSAPPTIVRYLAWMTSPGELSAYVQNPYVTRPADPRLLGSLLALEWRLFYWGGWPDRGRTWGSRRDVAGLVRADPQLRAHRRPCGHGLAHGRTVRLPAFVRLFCSRRSSRSRRSRTSRARDAPQLTATGLLA